MKAFIALYAVASYVLFLVSFLWAIAFVGDFAVPKTIDAPPGPGGWTPWLVDALVLGAFAVQHSVMARPAFKRWWTGFVPVAIERSTYVLASSLLLLLILAAWQPLPQTLWDLRGSVGGVALAVLQGVGWVIVLLSTFMISHFDLFGLAQAWRAIRGAPRAQYAFTERFLYRFVRHPIMLGFVVAFWSAPHMTVGHLLFSLLTTGYILVGVQLEERDLAASLGAAYERYRERVPMLLPLPRRAKGIEPPADTSHQA